MNEIYNDVMLQLKANNIHEIIAYAITVAVLLCALRAIQYLMRTL